MAETTNQAIANYSFSGSTEINSSTSNVSYVTLNDEGSIRISKTSDSTTFVPGSTVTFYVTITNTGSLFFSGVRLTDDLTGTGYLTYIPGSAKLYINGQWLSAQVVSTNPLVCTLSQLSPSASYVLMYSCNVSSQIPASVTSLTNRATGIGYTFNSTVTNSDSLTLTRASATDLVVTKTASSSSVNMGESFNYIIELVNQNNLQANISSLTDQLPENFTLSRITIQIGNGSVVVLRTGDYTLSTTNLLTLPAGTGPVITVPGNNSGESNKTIITLSGYFEN